MTKQRVGLILFWIGALWAVLWGVVVSIPLGSVFRTLTMDELNQTIWAYLGFWNVLRGLSPPLGALVAGSGVLLLSGAKGPTVWKYGIGILVAVVVGSMLTAAGHFPRLFGIGGALILFCFLGSLWFWARERMTLEDSLKTVADLRLVAYVFFVIAAWYICGAASQPFLVALEGEAPITPIHIMVFSVLGWLFLFLSQYRSGRPQDS